jgi:cysteinyl-tRNA synthetase
MKNIKILSLVLLISIPTYALAKGSSSQGQQNSTGNDTQQQGQGNLNSGSDASTGASYQNQVKTQNEGESQQIQVSTQQQAEGEGSSGNSKSINEYASDVAKYVQELLNSETLTGGIGEKVREVARLQNQSQEKIKEQINSVENRNKLMKLLLGTNYDSIKTMQQELEKNQERVRSLLQLKDQATDLADKQDIQGLIDSLNVQNTAIQDKISNETKQFSLFGWLSRLLSK